MRRMYSKEQLNKLIEEVSKLIAIEELDKVVPVPDISKAGYYMQVNAAGTGYQLVASPETTPLYCHPLRIYKGGGDGAIYALSALIFNNSSTKFTLATFKQWIRDLSDNVGTGVAATILMTGYYNDKKESPTIVQSAAYLYVLKQGENSYLYGVDGANVGGTTTASTSSESVDELFPAGSTTFVDAVNRIL